MAHERIYKTWTRLHKITPLGSPLSLFGMFQQAPRREFPKQNKINPDPRRRVVLFWLLFFFRVHFCSSVYTTFILTFSKLLLPLNCCFSPRWDPLPFRSQRPSPICSLSSMGSHWAVRRRENIRSQRLDGCWSVKWHIRKSKVSKTELI